jgi:hypothetical protein
MMERGTHVVARDYRNRELARVVWEDVGLGILLCTPADYERAQRDGGEPVTVGFPRGDVRPKAEL